jgi:preprotein translocase subunit SecE
MSTKVDAKEFRLDGLKWLLVVLLVAVGVIGNSYFSEISVLYRVLALLVGGALAAYIAVNTAKGSAFWGLMRDAQVEFRRVVWPTRQEVNQTTMIVVAVVIVMSIILWLLDTFLGWLASLIIG